MEERRRACLLHGKRINELAFLAGVAKLVDASDLGSDGEAFHGRPHIGSIPISRTTSCTLSISEVSSPWNSPGRVWPRSQVVTRKQLEYASKRPKRPIHAKQREH